MLLDLIVTAVKLSFPQLETVTTGWLADRIQAGCPTLLILDTRNQVCASY
jgi:hypothetical protein